MHTQAYQTQCIHKALAWIPSGTASKQIRGLLLGAILLIRAYRMAIDLRMLSPNRTFVGGVP